MNARETVRSYYDALRAGDPLAPYVPDERDGDDTYVTFGVSERLVGSDRIREGLRTQTETTTDWRVTSRDLRVTERDDHAWFSDAVAMA
nr:nuclear transport factor 2 family protein [Halorubrum sp. Atlit-26R]